MASIQLPQVFDQAKNPHLGGGYSVRFRRPRCRRCVYYALFDGVEGCTSEGFAIPLSGPSAFRKCSDYKKKG